MLFFRQVYWPLTKVISELKRDLYRDVKLQASVNARVDGLLHRPLVSHSERLAVRGILDAGFTDKVISLARGVSVNANVNTSGDAGVGVGVGTGIGARESIKEDEKEAVGRRGCQHGHQSSEVGVAVAEVKEEVTGAGAGVREEVRRAVCWTENSMDVVTVHRVALEALNRIALKGHW